MSEQERLTGISNALTDLGGLLSTMRESITAADGETLTLDVTCLRGTLQTIESVLMDTVERLDDAVHDEQKRPRA